MPRVAEDRPPAEPSSPLQKERYRRILRAAAEHASVKGLERVQMLDVARDAEVAIATLYRYFPSKAHLFTAMMREQVERLVVSAAPRGPGEEPEDGIARLLVGIGAQMLGNPLLAHAMLQSNNAIVAQAADAGVTEVFIDLMLTAGGLAEPTDRDVRLLRLIEQAWYGILMTALNEHIGPEELAADTELMCRLLLRGRDEPMPS